MSIAENGSIDMDLRNRSLTAIFSEKEIAVALNTFDAYIAPLIAL
jgi:hypothetical protein